MNLVNSVLSAMMIKKASTKNMDQNVLKKLSKNLMIVIWEIV